VHRISTSRRRALEGLGELDRWAEQWVYERAARADAARFAEIERFCLFVGFPRSGGSLVGAMLDAHPDMAIAQELGALRKMGLGYSKAALYAALLKADRKYAESGWQHQGFDYAVRASGRVGSVGSA
jgi:hypothetical protein